MYLRDVLTITKAQVFSPNSGEESDRSALDREVRVGFGSDLMSDVLCYDLAEGLLITGLANLQVIRTAEMADVAAILIVRGKRPMAETIELAQKVDIPILGTQMTMFEACGRLYGAGLRSLPGTTTQPG
jgi:predicted transcriptional regulator